MTKKEMVQEMAQSLGISQKQCGETLNVMLEEILKELEMGGKFVAQGFGTFKCVDTNERVARNPSNNVMLLIPKKRKLRFKISSVFKGEINE